MQYGEWLIVGNQMINKIECRCSCGTVRMVNIYNLKSGKTKSCGCKKIKQFKKMITRHGLRYRSEYGIWLNMKSRCYNKNTKSFPYYGGRGIIMCDGWREDFVNFYRDMGPRPSMRHEIDRIDNDGIYHRSNCRWVRKVTNARNKANSKWWFVNGIRYESLTHAATSLGVTFNTIKKWCDGRNDGGYTYPPKDNCWSENKYET